MCYQVPRNSQLYALFPLCAGSQTLQGEAVGFETEATAILDTMAYIRPEIYTLVSESLDYQSSSDFASIRSIGGLTIILCSCALFQSAGHRPGLW